VRLLFALTNTLTHTLVQLHNAFEDGDTQIDVVLLGNSIYSVHIKLYFVYFRQKAIQQKASKILNEFTMLQLDDILV
jgi:hypothetical protein